MTSYSSVPQSVIIFSIVLAVALANAKGDVVLEGTVRDKAKGTPLAARIYVQNEQGQYLLVQAAQGGQAIGYEKKRPPAGVEIHTTVSSHGFAATLPPGRYTVRAEHGKEYLPAEVTVNLSGTTQTVDLELTRWIDMGAAGWYSGETHVHRTLSDMPLLMLAEDLNVGLPLTYWVTRSDTPPTEGKEAGLRGKAKLIEVDPLHVLYPLNTEYEIFSVGSRRHTLGAVFALNHRNPLTLGAPPVGPIAKQVHEEGGLLELDKHNWPWSMMLVPVMNVDLYELANNHMWRTEFCFTQFGEAPAEYMNIERNERGWTEWGWVDFTFQNYYALLNCGFPLKPTAGTASGVHPVPLGFGRVYIHLPDGFSYQRWMDGLAQGRSFVSTGPMLQIQANDAWPGDTIRRSSSDPTTVRVHGWARSPVPLERIEIVVAGEVAAQVSPRNVPMDKGGFETRIDQPVSIEATSWLAVRCFATLPGHRIRFAHTGPIYIQRPGSKLRPRRVEVEYLVGRIEKELDRNRGVLSDAAMAEYEQALSVYRGLLEDAR